MTTAASMASIKALRNKTGAGIMDCKAALLANDSDMAAAEDWLRKKGIVKASQKSSRSTGEGVIAMAVDADKGGVLLEINAETDFVARNHLLQDFAQTCAASALEDSCETLEALLAKPYADTGTAIGEKLTELTAQVGEHLVFKRLAFLSASSGVMSGYIHNAYRPSIGRLGVLVALQTEAKDQDEFGRQLAMHIAAMNPLAVGKDQLSQQWIEREKAIILAQNDLKDKPPAIAEKIAEGRLRKRYEDVVLLEQIFVIDGKTRIKDVLAQHGNAQIAGFRRFALGGHAGDEDA